MDNTTNSTFSNSTFEDWQAQQTPKSFWTNLTLPVLYLTLLIGSLYTFSSLYRKRKATKAAQLEGWFSRHKQRDIYLSLLHLDPAEDSGTADSEKKLSRVPDSILKAALLNRAIEDIKRIIQLRTSKAALQTLLQRGSIGEELWQRFLRAEQEIEAEVKDVMNEANAFAPGWGQVIFQSAGEMHQNTLLRQRMVEMQSKTVEEKEWWEARRATMQSQLLTEIDSEKDSQREENGVLVEAGGPASAQGQAQASGKKKGTTSTNSTHSKK